MALMGHHKLLTKIKELGNESNAETITKTSSENSESQPVIEDDQSFVKASIGQSGDKATQGGVLAIFIYGGVRMKDKIQTQKNGFTINFASKNIVILHIFYPKV